MRVLNHLDTLPRWLAYALPCCFFVISLRYPPIIGGDFIYGYEVWDSMARGAPWNSVLEPDPADISRDLPRFVTWWTPVQYLVPGVLERLGLSMGLAISTTLLLCALLGLYGCARLYRQLGFSARTTAIALLLIATGWHLTGQFRRITGAEPMMFAAAPWIVAFALRQPDLTLPRGLALSGLFLLGSFVKLSMTVMNLGVVATTWLLVVIQRDRTSVVKAIGTSAAFGLAYACLFATFLRFGMSPLSDAASALPWQQAVLVPTTFAVSNVFAFGSLLGRVLQPSWIENSALLLVLTAGLWFALAQAVRAHRSTVYGCAAVAFVCTYSAVYAWFYLRGSAVGLEDRLFRPAGLIVLPGLVALVAEPARSLNRRVLAPILAVLFVSASAYGLASYGIRIGEIRARGTTSHRGFTHDFEVMPPVTPRVLDALHRLDTELPRGNELIASIVPLETPTRRSLWWMPSPTAPVGPFRGRVDRVIVALPHAEGAGGLSPRLTAFVDYEPREWNIVRVDDWDIFFTGPPIPAVLRK